MLNLSNKTNHFLIGMGSVFNIWGNYYSSEYINEYCKFTKRDTSVETAFKDVGKYFDWSINEYRK